MKKRNRPTLLVRRIVIIFAVATIAFVGIILSKRGSQPVAKAPMATSQTVQSASRNPTPPADNHRQTRGQYLRRHQNEEDHFWLRGNEDDTHWRKLAESWRQRALRLLNAYQNASPMTRLIYGRFHDFYISSFNTQSQTCQARGQEIRAPLSKYWMVEKGIDVCLVAKADSSQLYREPVTYMQGVVMVVAMDVSDTLLAGFLYHELGHAYRQLIEKNPSAEAADLSDLSIEEEMAMHATELRVLNQASNGQLVQLYEKIRARATSTDPIAIVNPANSEDMAAFDRMMDNETAGYMVARLSCAQFYIGLAINHLEETVSDEATRRTKEIEFFRRDYGGRR